MEEGLQASSSICSKIMSYGVTQVIVMTIHLPKNAVSFKIHPTSFVETLCKSRLGTNVGHRNQRPHKFVHNCNVHLVFASYAASYVYIDFSWYMSNAMTLYKSKEGKPFGLAHRWTLLNKCSKWQDLVVLSLNNPQHYIQEAKGHQWLKLIVDPHGWRCELATTVILEREWPLGGWHI